MVTFCVFVMPWPYQIRKKLFHFLSESKIVAKVAYALKISFMFVAFVSLSLTPLHACQSGTLTCSFVCGVVNNVFMWV